jgi:exopolysaccharide biosynthesis WecB/TagA/CpsF family protein
MGNILEAFTNKLVRKADQLNHGSTIFLNPYSYLHLRSRMEVVSRFDNICVDGGLLALCLSPVFGKIERVSFDYTSLADSVFEGICEEKQSLYVVGSDSESISIFVRKLKGKYDDLNIKGYRHGYFDSSEVERILSSIARLNPDVLVVGMGTPLQEEFIVNLQDYGWSGRAFTCGGFIHQTASSSNDSYYPAWINSMQLRWAFRIYDEPKLFFRYAWYYPVFLVKFSWDLLRFRSVKSG